MASVIRGTAGVAPGSIPVVLREICLFSSCLCGFPSGTHQCLVDWTVSCDGLVACAESFPIPHPGTDGPPMTRIGNKWMEGLICYGLLEKITEMHIKRAAFLCAHISAFSNEMPAPVKGPTINNEKGYFRCAATKV